MKIIFSLLLLFLSVTVIHAQIITASGKVFDKTGKGISGLNVNVKGTKRNVLTDKEGQFKITVGKDSILLINTDFQPIEFKAKEYVEDK